MNKEMFNDVVVFMMSEVGAMGPNNFEFYKKNGESFVIEYRNPDTPYSLMKECFPMLKDCYFNGPMKNEAASFFTIVIGDRGEETRVADGWKHYYLDVGNHLVIKEEYYDAVYDIIKDVENYIVTFEWVEMLNSAGLKERISEIDG